MSSSFAATANGRPLNGPIFRHAAVAYTVNEFGNWFGTIALAVAVFDHTGSALATAGLFVAARFVPALLVPALVARLESLARRRTLSALYLFEALVIGALAIVVIHPSLAPVLILAAVDGTAALTARALLRAVVAQRAGDERTRRRANALLNFGFTASAAAGPALAGVIVAAIGPPATLGVDGASFLLAAALVLSVPTPQADAWRQGLAAQLSATWRHLSAPGVLRVLLATEATALIFFAAVVPVEVVFAKATLHAGDAGYGALLGCWGIGMLLGSAIFARSLRTTLGPLLAASTLAVGLAYLGTALAPSLGVACAAALLGGTGNGVQWIALISAVQGHTPTALQGRTMGVVEGLGGVCPAIGFILGGAIAALASPRATFAVAGGAVALSTIVFARLARRGLAAPAFVEVLEVADPTMVAP
jgi:MFS family permease